MGGSLFQLPIITDPRVEVESVFEDCVIVVVSVGKVVGVAGCMVGARVDDGEISFRLPHAL